ncbi:MAG: TetR family transcriptional regulator [Bdellovibrionaceae bacterium]|nr:TetR family transcriptional regulator [Pseudobdellovibrionaceae bacterium]MBX3034715.1 TetR family transcriptional regulator [Pseudobdellovibrionaceae bacterium]
MALRSKALNKTKRVRSVAATPDGAREKLLKVALHLFSERGLDGVSVRDISKEAKLNVSLVSYYFGGKEGLYEAILMEHMNEVHGHLRGVIEHFANLPISREVFAEEIRLIVKNLVEARLRTPAIAQIMQRERVDGLRHSRKVYEEIMAPLADQLVGLVERAQAQGVLRRELNARAYFICMIESLFGYFIFHDCKVKLFKDAYRFPKDKDAFIEHMVLIFTQGVFA